MSSLARGNLSSARPRLLGLLLSAVVVTGCAQLPSQALEDDVRVSARQQVSAEAPWRREGSQDAVAEGRVAELIADGITVDEAVQIALLRNPDLQLAFEELGVARASYLEAALAPNPVLDVSVRALSGGPGEQVEFGVVQNLLGLLTLPSRRRAARAELEGAKLAAADAVVALAADTRAAFLRLLAAQRGQTLREQGTEAARLVFELAERYQQAGNLTLLERERERNAWLAAQSASLESDVELRQAREALGRLMGITSSHADWQVVGELPPLPDVDPALDALLAVALERRLDIQAARRIVDARLATLSRTRRLRLLPQLEAGASTERDPDGERVTGPHVGFELPLFSRQQAAIASADAQARAAMRRTEAIALDAHRDIRVAHARMVAARKLAETYRLEVIPARERITEGEQREFAYMLKGPFDPLRAKQSELEAEARLAELLGDYWAARVELARAAGDLSELERLQADAPADHAGPAGQGAPQTHDRHAEEARPAQQIGPSDHNEAHQHH